VLVHPFEPVFDGQSRVLILGSFPSPKSREAGFYYGNPRNAFWRTLARTLDTAEPPPDPQSRKTFLLENRIALWDVLRSCEIDGAKDGSITSPVANNFLPIIERSAITAIFTTGKKATELYNTLSARETGIPAQYLPSTSPANISRWNKPSYIAAWRAVKDALSKPSAPSRACNQGDCRVY
jgi:hypoxanthine-DNA glycosylase